MNDKWYYDTKTGQAVQGKQAGFLNRIGPFDTEAEARHALETVAARNKAWEEQDADEN